MASYSEVLTQGAVDTAINWLNAGANARADEAARGWQEEMWNKQNEYNLPVNQVARLKEAGINPNLAFGSSASAMGTSVPGSPSVHPAHFTHSNYGQLMLAKKQLEADLRLKNVETHRKEQENRLFDTLIDKMIDEQGLGLDEKMLKHRYFLEHGENLLDLDLESKELSRDLLQLRKVLVRNQSHLSQAQYNTLKQQWIHLKAKYGFEDKWYRRGMLPPGQGNYGNKIATSVIPIVKEAASALDSFFSKDDVRNIASDVWEDVLDVFDNFGSFMEDLWIYGL